MPIEKELKDLLEGIGQKQDTVIVKLDDHEKKIDEHGKQIVSVVEDVEKLKALPAGDPPPVPDKAPAIIQPKMFFGRNLDKMGLEFKILKDENREKAAKFVIAVIEATKKIPSVRAMQYLEDMNVPKDPEQKTAMTEGTSAYGGYIVPEFYESEVLNYAVLRSWIMSKGRIWPMASDTLRIPSEGNAVSVSWYNEAGAITESEPTFNEVTLTAKKLGAYSIASNELLADAMIDVVSYLTERFGEAIGLELDNKFLNGTGTPCSGILTAACGYSVAMGSGLTNFSSVTCTHLSEMMSKLRNTELDGAEFIMHRTVFHYLRSAKDSNQAFVYAQPGANVPESIWGIPYNINEKSPSTTGSNTAFIALANPRYFCLGRRMQNMTLGVNPYSGWTTDQTYFRILNRWAMSIGLANSFVRLLTASS